MEDQYNPKKIKDNVLSMIIPITFENILQMAAGLVSMAFVGRINPVAIGAMGLSNILFRIAWSLFKGLGVGSSAYVARSYGAHNNRKISSVTEQGIVIVLLFSILFQQILYWNSEHLLLNIFKPSQELLYSATIYLKIISWSLPFAAMILFIAGVLQGMGDAKTPMIIVSVLNIVNIIFSYLLIFGNLGFPELGLRGAGYAYNIAHIISAGWGVYYLIRNNMELNKGTEKQKFGFRKDELFALMKYGLPTSLELSFFQIASIFITRAILFYGETAYAAYQLGLQAESVSYMPATGLAIAATSFIGQSLGSHDKKLSKMYLDELFKQTIIITLFAGGMLVLFPKLIMRALTDDLEVIGIGATYLFVMGLAQMPQNLSGLYNGALRGAGYPNTPMINVGIGLWCIRIPLILLVSLHFQGGIIWIWSSMALDLLFRYVFAYFIFKKRAVFKED